LGSALHVDVRLRDHRAASSKESKAGGLRIDLDLHEKAEKHARGADGP